MLVFFLGGGGRRETASAARVRVVVCERVSEWVWGDALPHLRHAASAAGGGRDLERT